MTMNKECAGAKGVHNYKLVGVYYQRGLFLTGVLCIFLTPLMYFSAKFLKTIGIKENMAKDAGDYIWVIY